MCPSSCDRFLNEKRSVFDIFSDRTSPEHPPKHPLRTQAVTLPKICGYTQGHGHTSLLVTLQEILVTHRKITGPFPDHMPRIGGHTSKMSGHFSQITSHSWRWPSQSNTDEQDCQSNKFACWTGFVEVKKRIPVNVKRLKQQNRMEWRREQTECQRKKQMESMLRELAPPYSCLPTQKEREEHQATHVPFWRLAHTLHDGQRTHPPTRHQTKE